VQFPILAASHKYGHRLLALGDMGRVFDNDFALVSDDKPGDGLSVRPDVNDGIERASRARFVD